MTRMVFDVEGFSQECGLVDRYCDQREGGTPKSSLFARTFPQIPPHTASKKIGPHLGTNSFTRRGREPSLANASFSQIPASSNAIKKR